MENVCNIVVMKMNSIRVSCIYIVPIESKFFACDIQESVERKIPDNIFEDFKLNAYGFENDNN